MYEKSRTLKRYVHRKLEPADVAFQSVLHGNLGQPLRLGGKVDVTDLLNIGEYGAEAHGPSFEAAEQRPAAAVAADLLIDEQVRSDSGDATKQREMLCRGCVEVELRSRLIVGDVVWVLTSKPANAVSSRPVVVLR